VSAPEPEKVAQFIEGGPAWVRQQRDLHQPLGQPLTAEFRRTLPFFPASLLERVRWRIVPVLPNAPFVVHASAAMGLDLDFSKMDGITFDDTFLITIAAGQGADPGALVFHELVHVVRFIVLGIDEFVEQYATGLIASRDY